MQLLSGGVITVPTSDGRGARWIDDRARAAEPFALAKRKDASGILRSRNFNRATWGSEQECWLQAKKWLEGDIADVGPAAGATQSTSVGRHTPGSGDFRTVVLSSGIEITIPSSGGRSARWNETSSTIKHPFVYARRKDSAGGAIVSKSFSVLKHKDERNCWQRAKEQWLEEGWAGPGGSTSIGGGGGAAAAAASAPALE